MKLMLRFGNDKANHAVINLHDDLKTVNNPIMMSF